LGKFLKYLYVLIGLTAAIGIVSGIGATCTTFDSAWWLLGNSKGGYTFGIIGTNQPMFILCYVVTWLVAISWGVLGWALRERKPWFYKVAVTTSIAGFFSGIIPVWILFYEYWQSLGVTGMPFTPSWFRAIANAALFVILLLPRVKNNLETHMAEKSSSGGESVGTQVANFSLVAFGFGLVLLIQPFIMPMTHQFEGDVYMYIGRQFEAYIFIVALIFLSIGVLLRFTGRVLNYYYAPKTTSVKT